MIIFLGQPVLRLPMFKGILNALFTVIFIAFAPINLEYRKICVLLASGLFRGGHPLGIELLDLGNGSKINRA